MATCSARDPISGRGFLPQLSGLFDYPAVLRNKGGRIIEVLLYHLQYLCLLRVLIVLESTSLLSYMLWQLENGSKTVWNLSDMSSASWIKAVHLDCATSAGAQHNVLMLFGYTVSYGKFAFM